MSFIILTAAAYIFYLWQDYNYHHGVIKNAKVTEKSSSVIVKILNIPAYQKDMFLKNIHFQIGDSLYFYTQLEMQILEDHKNNTFSFSYEIPKHFSDKKLSIIFDPHNFLFRTWVTFEINTIRL